MHGGISVRQVSKSGQAFKWAAIYLWIYLGSVSTGRAEDLSPASAPAAPSAETEGTSQVVQENVADEPSIPWNVNYFSIFYGPSIHNPSSYQPTPDGALDPSRPLLLKNYLTLGYDLSPDYTVAATGYWLYQPVMKQELDLMDPFVRISANQLIHGEGFNHYADFRVHIPVSATSRATDLLASFQTWNVTTYEIPSTRLTLGAYTSVWFNYFGKQGAGDMLELYFAPNLNYQMSRTVAATLVYEMGASHPFGDTTTHVYNDGTDLQPGVSWDITPRLNFNPYLTLYTGNKVTLDSTAMGMMLWWKLL